MDNNSASPTYAVSQDDNYLLMTVDKDWVFSRFHTAGDSSSRGITFVPHSKFIMLVAFPLDPSEEMNAPDYAVTYEQLERIRKITWEDNRNEF